MVEVLNPILTLVLRKPYIIFLMKWRSCSGIKEKILHVEMFSTVK